MKYFVTFLLIAGIILSTIIMPHYNIMGAFALISFVGMSILFVSMLKEKF